MKIVLIIIASIIALLVVAYAYYGGFSTISFSQEEQGGETFVYEEVVGDYKQTPTVMDSVYYALLNDEKIETTKGCGVYYDNPQKVEKSKLRSEVGSIVENQDSTTIARLSQKFKVKTLPKTKYVVTEFPMKGSLSALVGIMKVYPALARYVSSEGIQGGVITEIYDVPNKKIIYRQEIITDKQ